MAVAGIGVFVTATGADEGPTQRAVVADRAIRVGERIEPRHVRVAAVELPAGSAPSFDDVEDVIGRVALGPIGDGELVQSASVTADRGEHAAHEVALTLPRPQIAVGRLRQGERVDVYATDDEHTWSVALGAEVVQIDAGGDGSLTSDRELTIVVAVETADAVAPLVHALRRADVTVVRSTFAGPEEGVPVDHHPGTSSPTTTTTARSSAGPSSSAG
jgi:Flp pilus assembly protein CpaB